MPLSGKHTQVEDFIQLPHQDQQHCQRNDKPNANSEKAVNLLTSAQVYLFQERLWPEFPGYHEAHQQRSQRHGNPLGYSAHKLKPAAIEGPDHAKGLLKGHP